jgi:flagella basal body P-ring formation protein FlgA
MLLGAAMLLPVHSYAQPPDDSGLAVELRAEVLLDHARIALADVAVIHAAAAQAATLADIELGHAPRVGYVERFSRGQIEQAIRRTTANAGPIRWSGATAVAVRTQVQTVTAQALTETATSALRRHLAGVDGRTTVSFDAPPADVQVPVGQVELRPRALPARPEHGRAPVWIDVLVNGAMYRSVVVPLAVSVRRQAYLARHDIDAGSLVTTDDFEVADADVAGIDALAARQPLVPFRAAHALRAGQPLTDAAMLAGGTVMRGDQVRLTIRTGAIGIDTAGVAMDDARPGQPVRVRPSGSQDVVTGHLGPSGAVIID